MAVVLSVAEMNNAVSELERAYTEYRNCYNELESIMINLKDKVVQLNGGDASIVEYFNTKVKATGDEVQARVQKTIQIIEEEIGNTQRGMNSIENIGSGR